MRLYLINPSNPLVSMTRLKESRWNRYRLWKPLSLMALAGLTSSEWEISILDENLATPDYPAMPRPDLVGITAFTSQANRAYEVAAHFQHLGVPVVMGGIHATMCVDEVMERVDSVVTGEAEGIWPQVLEDARHGSLKRRYDGGLAEINDIPFARHDLLATGYAFGAIQTTRGCPLNCSFCSVTAFNGAIFTTLLEPKSFLTSPELRRRSSHFPKHESPIEGAQDQGGLILVGGRAIREACLRDHPPFPPPLINYLALPLFQNSLHFLP